MGSRGNKVLQFLLNPRLLICVAIAWLITNGWSYILFGIGTYFEISWMTTIAGAYITFLWLPISHCTWELTSVADFQSAVDTNPSHPLSEMTKAEKDLIYKKLSLEIKKAFA